MKTVMFQDIRQCSLIEIHSFYGMLVSFYHTTNDKVSADISLHIHHQ